jgi:cytidine deaminase
MTNQELIEQAQNLINPRNLSDKCATGSVGCVLVTDKDNIYTGVNIDATSGIGFCAECATISSMVTNGESRINTIVAVGRNNKIYRPCGRCREFMYLVNKDNMATDVILAHDRTRKLKELLPEPWQDIL